MDQEGAPDTVNVTEILVDNMKTNDVNPNVSYMRRGATEIQNMLSEYKRKRNREPTTPAGLKLLNKKDSPSDEENTEGSDSESPAFDPTSPPYSVETTESSGKARIQGQGTALDFTPVREPEPALEFEPEERTDMSMFIAPVVMNSAQIAQSNWMVDSGAGIVIER